jgi:hypothetical protein
MAYLDVNPMMIALRTTPEEFELQHGWLHHIPSRHSFEFTRDGHVQVRADCNCALLSVQSTQEKELAGCYQTWLAGYWRPVEINREFASHFQRSAIRRFLIRAVAALHRRLMQSGHSHRHRRPMMVPAE